MPSIFQATRAHRCRRLGRLPVVVLLLLATKAAGAQTDGVNPGDRVRFRVGQSESFQIATVARLTADTLSLESCTTCMRLAYARDEVNHLDVFRIRGDRGDRTLMGILFGAVIGGAIGYLMSRTCTGYVDACELSLLAVPAGGILGGIFGGVAGFLTGYTWQPVGTDR